MWVKKAFLFPLTVFLHAIYKATYIMTFSEVKTKEYIFCEHPIQSIPSKNNVIDSWSLFMLQIILYSVKRFSGE